MANDRRDDRRGRDDREDRGGGGGKHQPWNLYEIQERKRPRGRSDADESNEPEFDFRECGIAWKMRNADGFNIETYFALPAGARLAILPRRSKDDRGR